VDSTLSAAPDHPDLVVRKTPGRPNARRLVAMAGVSPPALVRAFNNTIVALERAVKERVFYVKNGNASFVPPPQPLSTDIFFLRCSDFVSVCKKFTAPTAPISRESFVDSFRGRKRQLYANALASLASAPFRQKDSYVKVFIKYEKTLFTHLKEPVPRVISPRSPRFNIEIGRYIRPIEEKIYKVIANVYGLQTVMKGMNAVQQARQLRLKWGSFKKPIAIGLDASRFDQHVSVPALQFCHDFYCGMFRYSKHRQKLRYLLNMTLRNKCFGNVIGGDLRYVVDGRRMSGDMDTSLGNCLLMCSMLYSYSKFVGVNIQLANNGDDCVVFMEAGDYTRFIVVFHAWFLDMGFNILVEEPVLDFERIVFCQTQPVYCGPGAFDYVMVRDPRVALQKDCVSINPLDVPSELFGWINAVGLGGLALTSGIPCWQSFYQLYVRSSTGKRLSKKETGWGWGVRMLANGMEANARSPSSRTRASFFIAFNISPDEQLCIEKYYASLTVVWEDGPGIREYVQLPF